MGCEFYLSYYIVIYKNRKDIDILYGHDISNISIVITICGMHLYFVL